MSREYRVGDLVRVKALPGISIGTLFDGKIGVIARLPMSDGNEYEIYVDDRTLWLSSIELVPATNSDG